MIMMENNSTEFCRFLTPCGYCELKKVECNKFKAPPTITYPIGGGLVQTPHFAPEDIKVGDWPPGPQPTCKDLVSDSGTFKVHFEDLPKYSTADSRCNDSSSTTDMYNLSGTLKSR